MGLLDDLDIAAGRVSRGGRAATGEYLGGLASQREEDRLEMQRLQQEWGQQQAETGRKIDAMRYRARYEGPEQAANTVTEMMNAAGIEGQFNAGSLQDYLAADKEMDRMFADKNLSDDQKYQIYKDRMSPFMTTPALAEPIVARAGLLRPEPTAARKPMFGAITDITKFTPESIKTAEITGSRGDLEVRPEFLQKKVSGKSPFDAEKDLRKEFTALSEDFRKVRDSYARVQESAKKPTAAGDLSLIFNFMKMLDPGSVVRESEFANAQTAQPLMERLGLSFDSVRRVWEGEKLSEVARDDFTNRARQLFGRQDAQHGKRVEQFKGIAKRNKLNSKNIILDLTDPLFEQEAEAALMETTLEDEFPDRTGQINQARAAGYGDEEIRAFLAQQAPISLEDEFPQFAEQIRQARAENISDEEIRTFLGGQ